ncbi:TlpA disulfide reductase family protein [Pedobacter nyackensis]|uniref:TlpA family protein disulfide reductase n=1 Tax=Pedobacter nyackensis TaxID=475255 RepID=UPI00292E5BE5|nr:TlpA disulfide reductase family protein [Pedobacter nyackensis]
MKKMFKSGIVMLLMPMICFSQNAADIISQVKNKQRSINVLSYTVKRTDTLGTYIRHMNGSVVMEKNVKDSIFGFRFSGKKEGDPTEKMYDGHVGYALDVVAKTYKITTTSSGIHNLLDGGGGHLVLPDMMNLDTVGVINSSVSEDDKSYLLLFNYADVVKYDVTRKFKEVKIDKQTMLPVSVRKHQESLGRIQDLYYEINKLTINPGKPEYDFAAPDFLANFQHIVPEKTSSPVFGLLSSSMPYFRLQVFANGTGWISTDDFKDKVVLLDFWEVWCGPCVESMPNIEGLFQKYKTKGLLVYGIVNDTSNIVSSKAFTKKRGFTLPMLAGSEHLMNSLKITGIPLYVLVDRTGKITFISEGYSNGIETAILKALER